jgi:hypothetical protein
MLSVTGVETARACGENEPTTWIFTGVILKGNAERTVNQEYSFSHDLL